MIRLCPHIQGTRGSLHGSAAMRQSPWVARHGPTKVIVIWYLCVFRTGFSVLESASAFGAEVGNRLGVPGDPALPPHPGDTGQSSRVRCHAWFARHGPDEGYSYMVLMCFPYSGWILRTGIG